VGGDVEGWRVVAPRGACQRDGQRLDGLLRALPEVKVLFTCQANAVFVELPLGVAEVLWKRGWLFYNFIGAGGCRFMCSWDTTEADLDGFVADVKSALK
jgi:threonine aldolase